MIILTEQRQAQAVDHVGIQQVLERQLRAVRLRQLREFTAGIKARFSFKFADAVDRFIQRGADNQVHNVQRQRHQGRHHDKQTALRFRRLIWRHGGIVDHFIRNRKALGELLLVRPLIQRFIQLFGFVQRGHHGVVFIALSAQCLEVGFLIVEHLLIVLLIVQRNLILLT